MFYAVIYSRICGLHLWLVIRDAALNPMRSGMTKDTWPDTDVLTSQGTLFNEIYNFI